MGEISESMLDGTFCDCCGVFLEEHVIKANGGKIKGNVILEAPGFPITCEDCLQEEEEE